MSKYWMQSVKKCSDVVAENKGPAIVVPVSGSDTDANYWEVRFKQTSMDMFNRDGSTKVISISEGPPKGNMFGTIFAWETMSNVIKYDDYKQHITLFSMLIGKGTRLSPFTQVLGNRKPAFPTPKLLSDGTNVCISEIANFCMNDYISYIHKKGFRGVLVKWGDEALISGNSWAADDVDLSNVDVIRFVSNTRPDPSLAVSKEWIISDKKSKQLRKELCRQQYSSLKDRLASFDLLDNDIGVNLGSFAISYNLLNYLADVFREDILKCNKKADWDPYFWIAFLCENESEWENEKRIESDIDCAGINNLETKYPDFFTKVQQARIKHESILQRPLNVIVQDFGEVSWIDMGMHTAVRQHFMTLLRNDEEGYSNRELYNIPHVKDNNGNIIVRSNIPSSAYITNSVIIDATITDEDTHIEGAVIIGGVYGKLSMPSGGISLFSVVNKMTFEDQTGISFKSIGNDIIILKGDRHTTLPLPDGPIDMLSNENIIDYSGSNYSNPIMGNKISFEDAGDLMSQHEIDEIDVLWKKYARSIVDSAPSRPLIPIEVGHSI